MRASDWPLRAEEKSKALYWSALLAFVFEFVLLTTVAWHEHWLSHPQKTTGLDTSKFIEAEVFKVPTEAPQLVEEKKIATPAKKEAVISKIPGKGKKAKESEKQTSEENQTQGGQNLAPTHGPVALFTPVPAIPEYLKDQSLKASVVIDFYVTAQGSVTPRLVGSSGNEELDAIALATAKKWQFRPAENAHHPIDSKVRLRILFEVQ